jgi:hypothetical protein
VHVNDGVLARGFPILAVETGEASPTDVAEYLTTRIAEWWSVPTRKRRRRSLLRVRGGVEPVVRAAGRHSRRSDVRRRLQDHGEVWSVAAELIASTNGSGTQSMRCSTKDDAT